MTTSHPLDIKSLTPAIRELERIVNLTYGHFADKDRVNQPPITIAIQTRGRKANCLGYFLTNGFSTKEGQPIHELTITAEWLQRSTLEIVCTAIHETVHLYNHDQGIKDCSDGGRHNKRFKATAAIFGLEVSKGSQGLNHTEPTPELTAWITDELQPEDRAFDLFKNTQPTKKSPAKAVWMCECEEGATKVSIPLPVTKRLDAECRVCDARFQIDHFTGDAQ